MARLYEDLWYRVLHHVCRGAVLTYSGRFNVIHQRFSGSNMTLPFIADRDYFDVAARSDHTRP